MTNRKFAPVFRCAAAACAGWITTCAGYRLGPDPLALGMSAQHAANSLGAQLYYITGPVGAEIYYTDRRAEIDGLGPVVERTFLQFKGGTLFGWTSGWQIPPDDALE